MKYTAEFRSPEVARKLQAMIAETVRDFPGVMTLMEVCGTHTMAIYQHGIRSLLPPQIRLISGPGCPVCVTPIDYVDHAVALARRPETIIATFGDMVRVPGSSSSLQQEQAAGPKSASSTRPSMPSPWPKKLPKKPSSFSGSVSRPPPRPSPARSLRRSAGG